MATTAQSFNGNLKKALAALRRFSLEGLRWRVFDAKGQVLGRLASHLSNVVQGKDKPTHTPNHDDGDMCIVLNAKDVCVTGRKLTDKFYQWLTGDRKLRIFVGDERPFDDRPLEPYIMPPGKYLRCGLVQDEQWSKLKKKQSNKRKVPLTPVEA